MNFATCRFGDIGAPRMIKIEFRTYLEQLIAGLQSQFRAEFAYIPFLDYIDLADSKNEDRFIFRPSFFEIKGLPRRQKVVFEHTWNSLLPGYKVSFERNLLI